MRLITFIVSAGLMVSIASQAQESTSSTNDATKKLSTTVTTPGTLSEKDVAELKSEWTDEKTGLKYMFVATFNQWKPTQPADKKKYEKSGKMPVRITCTFYEVKMVQNKPLYKRLSGASKFYITGPDNKVVLTQTVSLDKMCPS